MQVIEIPAGSRFIAAWELGRRIGALLHPTPDTPPLLVSLQKKIPRTEPTHFRVEELSDADLLYLRAVWKEIDIPDALNMSREQWAQCKAAFQAAPDRPAWDLAAGFRDYVQEARSEQFRIANKHVQAMNALISSGALRAYDAELAPVQKVDGWGAQLRVEDARAYLAELGIELRESMEPGGLLGIVATMNQSLTQQASEALASGYRASEGPYRRVLPTGKRFFTVGEGALEIARALHPEQSDDPKSALVAGFFLVDTNDAKGAARPAEEHASVLDEIWLEAILPPPVFPMAQSTFDAYALALSTSKRGREWALRPLLRSRRVDADILCAATRIAHEELLRRAVVAGQITLLHPATKTPIGAAAAGDAALIRRDDLVKFAASLPEPVELVDAPDMRPIDSATEPVRAPQTTPRQSAPGADAQSPMTSGHHRYRQRAQEDEIMRVLGELGYDPRSLPKREGTEPGPKSEVRKKLSYTQSVFDKAWERLRASGAIGDAEP